MAVSDFILGIGKEIEEKSGLYVNFAKGTTSAEEEKFSEDQFSRVKGIKLRTAKESQNEEVIKLLKFNPGCRLKVHGRVRCRVAECEVTTPEPTDLSAENKQDLFLCDEHREALTNLVLELCAKENVAVNVAEYTHEDFNGYTDLIGLLDVAFRHMKKSYRSSTDSVFAEVFLNTRNFLIIVNALLNPDEGNERTFLASFLTMFRKFLRRPFSSLRKALRKVVKLVLGYFGISYAWVLFENFGSKLGAGIGLSLGALGSVWCGSSMTGILATSVVGFVVGKLIGGGAYDWNREPRDYIFRFVGTEDGDLDLNIEEFIEL